MCVRAFAVALSLLLVVMAFPPGSGHVWNHESKGELCGVAPGELAPHGHSEEDGHGHWHHTGPATAAHSHAGVLMGPGHTHSAVTHDPCLQTRMDYPDYFALATMPLAEVDPPEQTVLQSLLATAALWPADDPNRSRVYVAGGEAYEFPIPASAWKKQTSFAITSDLQAAGMGLPGTGTPTDPYIIEGYLIKGNLLIKNTSKCFVIKNNVVVNRVLPAPILPDPEKITALKPLIPILEAAIADAQKLRDDLGVDKAAEDAAQAARDAAMGTWKLDLAQWQAQDAQWEAQEQAWQADWDQFAADYFAAVQAAEELATGFEAFASQYQVVAQPPKAHAPYVDYAAGTVTDLVAAQDAFETYQESSSGSGSLQDWIAGAAPGPAPPAGWGGSQADWDALVAAYEAYQAEVDALVASYWSDLMAGAPDESAHAQFQADKAAFDAAYAEFMAAFDAFVAEYGTGLATYQAFMAAYAATMAQTSKDIAEAQAGLAKAAKFDFEYAGKLGSKLFTSADELLKWAVKAVMGLADALDPNAVAQNTGQLILDWNGQCLHAYNNVVHDLRVNQNNDRTGFATGGVIEDNRFYTIGQIRHYDGVFRDNEVGNRAFLHQLVKPSIIPAPVTARSINNDGANQGWYYGNTIYGQVDLDFHGHHHSAGFFAPESHYHGSTATTAYMRGASGACTATYGSPDPAKRAGPHWDHPTDNDVQVLGATVLEQADPAPNCLPHFDHGKRWTSVLFNDNLVIDPNGVGLRFEDRDHRGDDEQANSENLRELKTPHYHQKWVQLEGNTVVGKIFVDVLNAAGTDLWNDNWAAVATQGGTARIQEASAHVGAEVVSSHPYRNDAWLDIQGNNVLQTQSTGILVSDAADMTLFQLKGNRGFAFPKEYQTAMTPGEMLAWLQGVEGRDADAVWDDLVALKGKDRGVQTFAHLAFLRNAFTVEHCGNLGRGLERGLWATDRIYDDQMSIIQSCGTSDYKDSETAVNIIYTPMPAGGVRCTEEFREFTADTDDFYASETGFDAMDGIVPAAACDALVVPVPRPEPEAIEDPVGYAGEAKADPAGTAQEAAADPAGAAQEAQDALAAPVAYVQQAAGALGV